MVRLFYQALFLDYRTFDGNPDSLFPAQGRRSQREPGLTCATMHDTPFLERRNEQDDR